MTCGFDSESLPLALNFTSAAQTSHLYSAMPAEVIASLTTDAFTLNYHSCGVTPAAAAASATFQQEFRVLSTNVDRKNVEFVSSIEAKEMPIYATQFHPELQQDGAEFCGPACHSDAAMSAAQEFANVFVRAARQSSHRFPREAFDDAALYQHHPYAMSSYGYYFIKQNEQEEDQLAVQSMERPRYATTHGVLLLEESSDDNVQWDAKASSAALGPIIGVLSVPDPPCVTYFAEMQQEQQEHHQHGQFQAAGVPLSCFASFYPDWLHTAGARIAPIPYTANATRLAELFAGISGLVFTGGGADISSNSGSDHGQYFFAAKTLWELALTANEKGDYFPIWGTCLGFQTVSVLASGNRSLLSPFKGVDGVSLPLSLTAAAKASRLLGHAPSRVLETLAKDESTVNLHHWGVAPAAYHENPKLASFFQQLSTNVDTDVSIPETNRLRYCSLRFHFVN